MLTNILPLKRSKNQHRGVAEQAGAPGCAGSSLAGGVASPRLRYSLRLLVPFSQAMSGCSSMIAFSAASSSDLVSAGRSSASLSDAGVSWRRALILSYHGLLFSSNLLFGRKRFWATAIFFSLSKPSAFSFPCTSICSATQEAARRENYCKESGCCGDDGSWDVVVDKLCGVDAESSGYRPCVYRCLLRYIFKSHQLNCLLPRERRVRCANMLSSPVRHNTDDHYGAIDFYRFVF